MVSPRLRAKKAAAYAAMQQAEQSETFQFNDWRPDIAAYPAPRKALFLSVATNVLPAADGFEPCPALDPLLVGGTQTTETIYSAAAFTDPDGINANAVVFGGSDKLYQNVGSYTITNTYDSGSGNETVPEGAVSVTITCWGGGAGGGGGVVGTAVGGGGGGSGARVVLASDVQMGEIGTTLAYSVGVRGEGLDGIDGTDGGDSTIIGTLDATARSLSAGGGAGGLSGPNGGTGGAGGAASGGDTNDAGVAGDNSADEVGGDGGDAPSGGEGGEGGGSISELNGSPPGGGGAGGLGAFVSDTAGGQGTFGRITFVWTIGTGQWTDVSRTVGGAYTTDPDEPWTFSRFGVNVIATQGNDEPQVFELGTSSDFANLDTGTNDPPNARYSAPFGSQLVLMNTSQGSSHLVASEIDDITEYPADGTNGSWELFLPDGGDITGGYEYGGAFWTAQAEMWRRILFVGDEAVIDQDVAVPDAGVSIPRSFVVHNGIAYYISDSGFKRYTPGAGLPEPIGNDKVDEYFTTHYAEAAQGAGRRLVSAAFDPVQKMYFAGVGFSGQTNLSNVFVYHVPTAKFALLDVEDDDVQCFLQSYIPRLGGGTELTSWNRTAAAIVGDGGGVNSFLATFDGANKPATLELGEFQWSAREGVRIKSARPLVDAATPGDVSVQVGHKEHLGEEDPTFYAAHACNSQMEAFIQEYARFARIRMLIASGASWTKARGVNVVYSGEGRL